MQKLKIALGCDHIVTPIKDEVKSELTKMGHEVIDCGTYNSVRTHYPIYGRAVALHVVNKQADLGVVICGTGVGITNSANKVKGARCMLVQHPLSAQIAREKYDANIIGFGGRIVGIGLGLEIIKTFLNSKPKNLKTEEIKLINEKIPKLNNDEHLFDSIINDWYSGKYTEGQKQPEVCLPKK